MAQNISTSGSNELNRLLAKLNQEGGFVISVLTDAQGFAIASASINGLDPERQSAVVAQAQKSIFQISRRLGLAQTDEMSVYTEDGQRLVCRFFSTKNHHDLVLAVTVPEKKQSYRRLTNWAINEIIHIWSQYWE